jgi:hypothetical protein
MLASLPVCVVKRTDYLMKLSRKILVINQKLTDVTENGYTVHAGRIKTFLELGA